MNRNNWQFKSVRTNSIVCVRWSCVDFFSRSRTISCVECINTTFEGIQRRLFLFHPWWNSGAMVHFYMNTSTYIINKWHTYILHFMIIYLNYDVNNHWQRINMGQLGWWNFRLGGIQISTSMGQLSTSKRAILKK